MNIDKVNMKALSIPRYPKLREEEVEHVVSTLEMALEKSANYARAEAVDAEHSYKTHESMREFVRFHFHGIRTCLNSKQLVTRDMKLIRGKLQGNKTPRVLDAGCGSGNFSRNLDFHCNEKLEVVGTDLNKKVLQLGKNVNRAADFILSDIQALPFKDQAFDLIICHKVIHELVSERGRYAAAREFSRVSKPKGLLHIVDKFTRLPVVSILSRLLQNSIRGVEWISNKGQLETILKQSRFRIVEIERRSLHLCGLITDYAFIAEKQEWI